MAAACLLLSLLGGCWRFAAMRVYGCLELRCGRFQLRAYNRYRTFRPSACCVSSSSPCLHPSRRENQRTQAMLIVERPTLKRSIKRGEAKSALEMAVAPHLIQKVRVQGWQLQFNTASTAWLSFPGLCNLLERSHRKPRTQLSKLACSCPGFVFL